MSEFPPAHLIGLADLAIEVGGWFVQFRERRSKERNVVGDLAVVKIAHPAGLENPHLLLLVPVGPRGEDTPPNLKRGRVDLDGIQSAEKFLVRVEKFVVVDLRVLAKDPLAAGLIISLRGPAFEIGRAS